jgi:hypothetical protein
MPRACGAKQEASRRHKVAGRSENRYDPPQVDREKLKIAVAVSYHEIANE